MSGVDDNLYVKPLEELLPHRAPLLLLDGYEIEGESFSAQVLIKKESLLFEESLGVPSWAGIEYMAQAAGVLAATLLSNETTEEPAVGFLVKVKSLKTTVDYYQRDQKLNVKIDALHMGKRESLFKGSIWVNEKKMSEAHFMTFLK